VIWVLNNYDEEFEVESITSQQGAIKLVQQEKDGKRYNLNLEIVPPERSEGKASLFTDELYVKIKGDETLKVICRGFYSTRK
jgi:hypothetical protein